MEHRALSREEEDKLNASLAEKLAGTDQLMARAGQMVSSFVGYPAYTVADHKTAATVRRFELIPVDANSFIAVVMLSDSQVKSQLLPLQLPVADGGLPDMSHLLNTHFTGIGPEDMNGRLMSLSEQVPGQWFLPLNQVVEYAGRLLKEANSQEVFPSGAKEFLRFPEYRDADKAHDLMTFMVDNKEQLPAPTEGGRCRSSSARKISARPCGTAAWWWPAMTSETICGAWWAWSDPPGWTTPPWRRA